MSTGPTVRPTAVCLEEERILLVRQRVGGPHTRRWSLPGGKLEPGETIAACLAREVREETGLEVALERLLYVCDRLVGDEHVVHITFLVRRVAGQLPGGRVRDSGRRPELEARMVPITELTDYGFGDRFRELTAAGFPDAGSYCGAADEIGL